MLMHCHVLTHEDFGMMQMLGIKPAPLSGIGRIKLVETGENPRSKPVCPGSAFARVHPMARRCAGRADGRSRIE
jgi:hypothetical protein